MQEKTLIIKILDFCKENIYLAPVIAKDYSTYIIWLLFRQVFTIIHLQAMTLQN